MNQEIKPRGYIHRARGAKDFMCGAATALPAIIVKTDGDWREDILPNEQQSNTYFDSDECVPFGIGNAIELYLDNLVSTGLLAGQQLATLDSMGYRINGQFRINNVFLAKVSGNTQNGNSFFNVCEGARNFGLVPLNSWTLIENCKTWSELDKPIPQSLLDMGKKFLSIVNPDDPTHAIMWEWILEGERNVQKLIDSLKLGALPLALPVCPGWNTNSIIQPCSKTASEHCVLLLYADKDNRRFAIHDNYDPFNKWLSFDYFIENAVRLYVNVKNTPTMPTTPFYHVFYKWMKVGDNNEEILALNMALRSIGLLKVIPSSVYDAVYTQSAVKQFQINNGIKDNGGVQVGPQTIIALNQKFDIPVCKLQTTKGDGTTPKKWYDYIINLFK